MHLLNPVFASFFAGSASHLGALAMLFILGFGIIRLGIKEKSTHSVSTLLTTKFLAFACLFIIPLNTAISLLMRNSERWQDSLPLHFCDVMALMSVLALLIPSATIRGISFFGILTASSQALISPNLSNGFPSVFYFLFFFSHGIIVIVALYLYFVINWKPRKYDFIPTQLFGMGYLVIIHPINILLNTNFGFTRSIPEKDSILSVLGEWPYYLFNMLIVSFLFLLAFNLIIFKKKSIR